ncbi:Cuticle protein [Homarus americanus]|uniref:Cuticle protein n=2 Tax=Homarus americanus TaxID=6706 RepID=A0A8J5KGK3_HOMAM|nr:Cuticle protein [Homarus americanus]
MITADQRASYGPPPNTATILQDKRTRNGYGEYSFQYETSDGTARQESGSQNDGQVSQGGWRYTSPEGQHVDITFLADHGGYQPRGDVLPIAPALPYQRSGN